MKKKSALEQQVEQRDASKKVNPLDLSSDQDLSIALMNLISLEEHFMFSGAKTQKTGFYDLVDVVRDMREKLMSRIVAGGDGAVMEISRYLLAASMRLMEVGTKALGTGKSADAYKLFDQAYELYSLFWGINMGLIDVSGVQKIAPDAYDATINKNVKTVQHVPQESKSVVKKLGDWVKNAVNCCIE